MMIPTNARQQNVLTSVACVHVCGVCMCVGVSGGAAEGGQMEYYVLTVKWSEIVAIES